MTWLRLVVKWHEWELLAIGIALVALLAVSSLVVVTANDIVAGATGCFPTAAREECEVATNALLSLQNTSRGLFDGAALFSFVIGAALGAPLPARELESGSAQMVFSLVPSRSRWVLDRLLPIALIVVTLTGLLAATEERVAQALLPGIDLADTFIWYGERGPLLVAHGMVGLTTGLLAGVLLGRVLGGLLLAGCMCASLAVAFDLDLQSWLRSVAIPLVPGGDLGGGIVVATIRDVVFHVPGWRYTEGVVRELALSLGTAVLCGVMSLLVIRRRRPT